MQWRMQDFLKEGSVALSRDVREFLKPRPLSIKTTPIFDRLDLGEGGFQGFDGTPLWAGSSTY